MPARIVTTMQVTVLGGCGAWPDRGRPCSGYLVEHEGFSLLVDPGYATFSALLEHTTAAAIDAVYVTHGHPDHCVDLNPLLRARVLIEEGLPRCRSTPRGAPWTSYWPWTGPACSTPVTPCTSSTAGSH